MILKTLSIFVLIFIGVLVNCQLKALDILWGQQQIEFCGAFSVVAHYILADFHIHRMCVQSHLSAVQTLMMCSTL